MSRLWFFSLTTGTTGYVNDFEVIPLSYLETQPKDGGSESLEVRTRDDPQGNLVIKSLMIHVVLGDLPRKSTDPRWETQRLSHHDPIPDSYT